MKNKFEHLQTAHCENGVTANLLRHHGVDFITEPMAFGLGAGLFYIQIPFLKVNGGPAISFRSVPGAIFKRTCTSLGISVERKRFKDRKQGMDFLDQKIEEGQIVGCQVGVYHLPYFPKEYRFHFNAHNIIVFGKEGDDYLISDPVMETETTISAKALERVRFAQGALAPKGQMYFPKSIPEISDDKIRKGIKKGIKKNATFMLKVPTSILGIRGIKYTARHIRKWHGKLGEETAGQYLAQIIRMQEEIGTGGGGFRFLYAAFLEQAYAYTPNDKLLSISEEITKAGDMWRDSAVHMAGIIKGRIEGQQEYLNCADRLDEIAAVEKKAFKQLLKLKL